MPLPPNRVDYLPIVDRPVIKWPNDARVALWISPNVEHYEYMPENEGPAIRGPALPIPTYSSTPTATTATASASGACWSRWTSTASSAVCR